MKKLFLLLTLVTSVCVSMAQEEVNALDFIVPGVQLTYEVDFFGASYDFICTFNKENEGMSVSYKMTNEDSTSGRIFMSKKNLESSTALYNYFSGGDVSLENETTVIVSQAIYQALKNGFPIQINPNGEDETMTSRETSFISCNINGSESNLPVLHGISDNNHEYWVLDAASFPVLLKMDLGWTIAIKSISY